MADKLPLSERLEREAAAWDDWNEDHPDDAAVITPPLLREAAELARRVEGAAVVEMPSRHGPALQGSSLVIGAAAAERMGLAGQRVRLVPEQGEGE